MGKKEEAIEAIEKDPNFREREEFDLLMEEHAGSIAIKKITVE